MSGVTEFERNILADRDRKHAPAEYNKQQKEDVPKIQYHNADLHFEQKVGANTVEWFWAPVCPFPASKIVVKDAHYRSSAGTATEFYVVIEAISSNSFAHVAHNSDKVVDRIFHVKPPINAYHTFKVKTQYPIGTDFIMPVGFLDISVEFSAPC